MIKLELLAPARNAEIAIDAINHGADAVYMGALNFGAREHASNTYDDIKKVVGYAHIFGVRVYITVNTIFYDREQTQVKNMINDLWTLGVDAIIIQDTGILEMDLPPIRFHMSTQANNRTLERVKFWENCGLSRVVLARELSIKEIKEIRKNTTIELEAFIHGALCVSYSGNCYMSCDINNRSANRGNCAQPCRLPYDLIAGDNKVLKKDSHLISLGDLETSLVFEDLIKAGVTSFKIEGRLKDSVYVKNITAHYNYLLNNFIAKNPGYTRASQGICKIDFEPDTKNSFNRGNTSYFINGRSQGMINILTPKSLGKYIGKITNCGNDWFTIDSQLKLINGDGICFQHNGELLGTQIIGITDKGYKPQSIEGIKPDTEIYRNRDHSFIKQVEKSNHGRKKSCDINVRFTKHEVVTTIKSDGVVVTEKTTFTEIAQNQIKAKENWQTQLSKLGDSTFILHSIEIIGDFVPHLPISTINNIRRNLISALQNKIRQQHIKNRTVSKIQVSEFYKHTVDYQENIANSLARIFYEKRGVKVIEKAFELEKPKNSEYIVMTTKYCLLFELGMCLKQTKKQNMPKLPFFLSHKERKYKLEFNCTDCLMVIKKIKT